MCEDGTLSVWSEEVTADMAAVTVPLAPCAMSPAGLSVLGAAFSSTHHGRVEAWPRASWDVTTVLNYFTHAGTCDLPGGATNKSDFLGFLDPELLLSPGDCGATTSSTNGRRHRTRLCVRYTFGDKVYDIAFKVHERILLPSSRAIYYGVHDGDTTTTVS